MRFVAGEQRDAAQRIQKRFALKFYSLFCLGRNDLAIVWIIAFDQFRDEQRLVEVKSDLSAAHADLDIAIIGKQALQFGYRLGWNNKFRLVAAREFQFDFDHSESPAVC